MEKIGVRKKGFIYPEKLKIQFAQKLWYYKERRKKKLKQATKEIHEEIVNYKNHLVETDPYFVGSSMVTHTEKMPDAERMKFVAAVFLREADFALTTACTHAAEDNIKQASRYLLEANHYYYSYQIVLTVISHDAYGAGEIEADLRGSTTRKVIDLFLEDKEAKN